MAEKAYKMGLKKDDYINSLEMLIVAVCVELPPDKDLSIFPTMPDKVKSFLLDVATNYLEEHSKDIKLFAEKCGSVIQ